MGYCDTWQLNHATASTAIIYLRWWHTTVRSQARFCQIAVGENKFPHTIYIERNYVLINNVYINQIIFFSALKLSVFFPARSHPNNLLYIFIQSDRSFPIQVVKITTKYICNRVIHRNVPGKNTTVQQRSRRNGICHWPVQQTSIHWFNSTTDAQWP